MQHEIKVGHQRLCHIEHRNMIHSMTLLSTLNSARMIGIADIFICVFDLALKKDFLPIKIVHQCRASSSKADDVEP